MKTLKKSLYLILSIYFLYCSSACSNMKLKIGDKAPAFVLNNQNGNKVSLESLIKNKLLVLYFYPKDETAGCTAEACKFRDEYEIFTENGAEVVGVSSDSEESHKKFIKSYNLPFQLLSDKGGKIRKKYDVPKTLGIIPGRVTYIINSEAIIIHIFNSQLNPEKHIEKAIAVIKKNN